MESEGSAAGHRQQESPRFERYRLARRISIGAGVLLAASAVLGHFTDLGAYPSGPPKRGEMLDMDLVARTRSLDSLLDAAQAQTDTPLSGLHGAEAMAILNDTVSRRFSHLDQARHGFFGNWLMWGAGTILQPVFPSLGKVHDPDLLLKRGHSALCGSQSYTLVELAQRAGIPARLVCFRRHVVVDAWYDDGWHMYDPDYELDGSLPGTPVHSVEQLCRKPSLLAKLYEGKIPEEKVTAVFECEEFTAGSFHEQTAASWKLRYLQVIEQVTEVLKFAVPLLMIVIGVWSGRSRRTPEGTAATQ